MKGLICVSLALGLCMFRLQAQDKEQIRAAAERFDYEEVMAMTASADSLDKECRDWRLEACRALGRWKEAERLLRSRLVRDSTEVGVWVDLAECCQRMGNLHESAVCYRRAVGLVPESGFLRQRYIQTLLGGEDFQQAKKACHDWLERDSAAATAYRLLGQTYEALDSMEIAFLEYRAAYHIDSLDAQTVARVANVFNDNGQHQDAVGVTETYRMTDTTNVDVNRQNAKAYCMLRRYPEAIQRYEALKRAGDRSFLTLYYLGISYFGGNWFYGAYENLKEALSKSPATPANVSTLVYFARSAARTSWKEEGVRAMEEAVKLVQPSDTLMGELYGMLAECYHFLPDSWKEVETMVQQYGYTRNYALLYNIGIRYEMLKDRKNAVRYLRKYMEEVPEEKRFERDEQGNILEDVMTAYRDAYRRVRKLEEERFFEGDKEEVSKQLN